MNCYPNYNHDLIAVLFKSMVLTQQFLVSRTGRILLISKGKLRPFIYQKFYADRIEATVCV